MGRCRFSVYFQVGSVFGYRTPNIGIGFRFSAGLATKHINSVLLICCMPKCMACKLAHTQPS